MTTINTAGNEPYRAYPAKAAPERFAVEAPERIIVGLASSPPSGVTDALKQRLLAAGTLQTLAMLPSESAEKSAAEISGNSEAEGGSVAEVYAPGKVSSASNDQIPAEFWNSSDTADRARGMIEAYGAELVMRSQMQDPELHKA
ncbi:hypothetical protein [Sphingosinicella sp. BN140058]|uniref:hypothetical protein n=1 Tax=Sphingosinicella sp. BN140058 TaxID=1892855 RepID=UPI001012D219|nr:hypothetical protein [Sphingosinicella sp. BN140058]QAY78310.1 hypothetical protein ETR14_18535 [Sphingosinicella sp. BN140058]